MVSFKRGENQYTNVVALIEGGELKDEYIVLGAHYDHLGMKKGQMYPGADDNASGSAALIEIARELSSHREELKRSIIIAAFDAEEIGLYGSTYLAEFLDALVGLDKVKLMMSVDMVGRYADTHKLVMEGVATIKNGKVLAKGVGERHSINVKAKNFETSALTATDTEAFARKQIPTLAVSTGLHPQYHKPTDTPDLIDYEGLDRISGCLSDLAMDAATDESFAASGRVARKHMDKAPVFQAGVTASLGAANLYFPSAGFTTDSRMDYTAGLTTRFNFSYFGFQADVLWEQSSARFPSVEKVFGAPQNYTQSSVTVPAYFLLRSAYSENCLFVGVGGYYSYVYSHSFSKAHPGWGVNPHQGGLALNFGMQVANLVFEWSFRSQLNDLFLEQNSHLNTATYIKFAWVF